jgi:hypothetical protein
VAFRGPQRANARGLAELNLSREAQVGQRALANHSPLLRVRVGAWLPTRAADRDHDHSAQTTSGFLAGNQTCSEISRLPEAPGRSVSDLPKVAVHLYSISARA